MSTCFKVHEPRAAGAGSLERYRTKASTQFTEGEFVKLVGGIIHPLAAATDLPTHTFICIETPPSLPQQATANLSTAAQEWCLVQPIRLLKLRHELVGNSAPEISGLAANANSTATVVVATHATSDNDYDNGVIYCHELDEQRAITDSQDTAGVVTFTVEPAFSRAVTTGDTITAVPFSPGTHTAVKLHGTTYSKNISTAPGDDSGGEIAIEDVQLFAKPVPLVIISVPDNK